MASIEDVISTKDPEVIKKKRSTIQRLTTGVRNSLDRLLIKAAGKLDHSQIKRLDVHDYHASLKKHYVNFQVIHEAYMEFRAEGKDAKEEDTLVLQDEKHYEEVRTKIIESFQLIEDYEESFKSYKAAIPDPALATKEVEEKSNKETQARQLKDEEALQKAEATAIAKEERISKELRANVAKKEREYNEAVGRYRTAKKYAEDMTVFARVLTKEQVVSQVIEFAHVRSLPTYDTKNLLLDRFKMATDAAQDFEDAIEAESRTDDIKN